MTDTMHDARPLRGLLADGRTVELRTARPGEHPRLVRLFEEMSAENLRLRFLGAGRRVGRAAADRACRPARPGRRSLVACAGDRVVGFAEYQCTPGTESAEVGLAVADDFPHDGVGRLLLTRLCDAARGDGITALTATTFWENRRALDVFTDLGLPTTRRFQEYEVHCTAAL
jgi:GNAT superfamily N-acetyltransferase